MDPFFHEEAFCLIPLFAESTFFPLTSCYLMSSSLFYILNLLIKPHKSKSIDFNQGREREREKRGYLLGCRIVKRKKKKKKKIIGNWPGVSSFGAANATREFTG